MGQLLLWDIDNSHIQFKGRTNEQSEYAYYHLTENAIANTKEYWNNILNTAGSNDNWIYVQPDENNHVDLQYWDYQCQGSDESQSSFNRIYWTDATTITMGGLAGHLIAPKATITIINCNHCSHWSQCHTLISFNFSIIPKCYNCHWLLLSSFEYYFPYFCFFCFW